MRKPVKIAGIGCGVVLLLIGGFCGWAVWELRPQPPDSSLPFITRNLRGDFLESQRAFKQRVQSRFPVGVKESRLVKELAEQGFQIARGQAYVSQSGYPCEYTWTISWRTDADHRTKDIDASIFQACL